MPTGRSRENDLTVPARADVAHEERTVPVRVVPHARAARSTSTSSRRSGSPTRWTPTSRAVTVLDRHSGTTGRAHVALTGDPSRAGDRVRQARAVRRGAAQVRQRAGMGVAEARFYRDLAPEIPVRVPEPWFAEFEATEPAPTTATSWCSKTSRRRAAGSRTREDDDIEARTSTSSSSSPRCTRGTGRARASTTSGDLAWIAPERHRRGDGGASFVQMAVDNLGDRLPEGFRRARRALPRRAPTTSLPLYREGACTLVHGDPHLGNLFVDTIGGDRTGFLDWAVIGRAPGIRDVAYVLCNSTPTEVRACPRRRAAVARYCEVLAAHGIDARRGHRVGAVPAVRGLRLGARPRAPRGWDRSGSRCTSASAAPNERRSRPSTSTASACSTRAARLNRDLSPSVRVLP